MPAQARQQRRTASRAGRPARGARRKIVAVAGGLLVVAVIGLLWRSRQGAPLVRDGAPSWSPDGARIVFYSERNGQPADLFVMDAGGSDERQLTRTAAAAEGYPSWSPDGRQIAFEADRPDGNFDVYVMALDGSNVRRLTTDPKRDVGPSWSPDGSKIVFMSDRAGAEFDIYVMNPDGSGVERLTNGATNWFPQYSPDGKRLTFHVWRDVNVFDIATRTLTRLTTDPANGMYPSWSPDGTRLAFMSWRNGPTEVFTMNADGSDQKRLVSMPAGSAIDPRWSPDGTRIVFVNTPVVGAGVQSDTAQETVIYSVEVATGRVKRLSR